MKNHKFVYLAFVFGVLSLFTNNAEASILYSQTIELSSGWNIVSTPKILDSHSFSATENSTNFDIYVLDPSKTSGWATLADLGQTEFTPLYGYFINNKTGANQILTFNYKADTTPNQRLFERIFSTTGWYSFGIANSSYALSTKSATSTDNNNPSPILSALVVAGNSTYDTVVDFTNASSSVNVNSVALADPWRATVSSDLNNLNDFRETKGYAVYIKQTNALYTGLQNTSEPLADLTITASAGAGGSISPNGTINKSSGSNQTYTITASGGHRISDVLVDSVSVGAVSTYIFSNIRADHSISATFASDIDMIIDIGNATSVSPANISVNTANQILGGFYTDIAGEPISVQTLKFEIATSGTTGPITNITVVNSDGAVVAGPIDEASNCSTGCTITFTDTVTFPIGIRTYTVKGRLPTGATGTIVVSATPSTWQGIQGQNTGNSISLASSSTFSMNTMTIKTATLAISVLSTPISQNIVPGGITTFANYQFDASQSGEDVRFGSIPLKLTFGGLATANLLTSCQLFDGVTALSTGSNVVNPTISVTTGSDVIFTLDSQFTVPKGTVKTLSLKCNVSSSSTNGNTFSWGISTNPSFNVTGVTSGSDVSEAVNASDGQTMTTATGSLLASVDSSTPSYKVVAGGYVGVTMGVIKFRATNEAVNLEKVGLILTSGSASDVSTAYLYNGATLLGSAIFTGSNTVATTSSFSLNLPKDTDVLLTIKADLATIGTSQTGTAGQLIKIDVTNAQGNGASSGTTLTTNGVLPGTNGIRVFKSFPVVTQDALASTGIADGKLMRFKVAADSQGSIGLFNLNFTIATSSFSTGGGVNAVKVTVYSDSSYTQQVSGTYGTVTGQFGSTATPDANTATVNFSATTNPLQVPAGTTYYFLVEGTVASTQAGTSVTTTLNGDAVYNGLLNTSNVSGDFVWSGNTNSTSVFSTDDWSNGYGVQGLPSGGFSQTRSN